MKYFLLPFALLMGSVASACDLCGCSASNQYLGILPGQQWNFIGIQYQYNAFTGLFPSPFENKPKVHSTSEYQTMQLWGRYALGKRYQAFVFIPYQYNVYKQDSVNVARSGIGDVTLMVNRVAMDKQTGGWQQLLYAGVGVKLPTGKHDGMSVTDKSGLPNMQPGTGSTDIMVNANYTLRHSKYGLNADGAYTFTTSNKDDYKYGNTASAGLTGFYTKAWSDITVMPQLGVRYEYALHDYDNYTRKWLNEQSGGYMCFMSAGVQVFYKQIGFKATWQLPVSQRYSAGNVTTGQKAEAGIFLLF